MKLAIKVLLAFFLIALSSHARAYVGPGAGLSAIGSIIAFIAAVLLVIVGFVWYPIKRLFKGKQGGSDQKNPLAESAAESTTPEEADR